MGIRGILMGDAMLTFLVAMACNEPAAPPVPARWPRPGLTAVLEVSARVDEEGRATAWSAAAWGEAGRPEAARAGACEPVGPRHDVDDLAAVDVTAPVPARLHPSLGRGMVAAGPLAVRDARWVVGDVGLLADDGTRTELPGALRFGDAVPVGSVVITGGGDALLRVAPQPDTTVEVDVVRGGHGTTRCTGTPEGLVWIPAELVEAAGGGVIVRGVHDAIVVSPNAALVRVRAVVEQVFSLTDPLASDRTAPLPAASPRVWQPRKVLRARPSWG
jgi:hypothetical protein